MSSLRRMFSGFRSLKCDGKANEDVSGATLTSAAEPHPSVPPVDDPLIVQVFQSTDDLSRVEAGAGLVKRADLTDVFQELSVLRVAEAEI